MIPKEVIALRKEVEDKKYRLSPNEIYEYTRIFRDLLRRYPNSINPDRSLYYKNGSDIRNDDLIAYGCIGLVVGAHGPYIEFTKEQFSRELIIPVDQQWRTQPKYRNNIKYLHKAPVGIPDLKIYHQLRTVSYADYEPGLYYIDYYLLSN